VIIHYMNSFRRMGILQRMGIQRTGESLSLSRSGPARRARGRGARPGRPVRPGRRGRTWRCSPRHARVVGGGSGALDAARAPGSAGAPGKRRSPGARRESGARIPSRRRGAERRPPAHPGRLASWHANQK